MKIGAARDAPTSAVTRPYRVGGLEAGVHRRPSERLAAHRFPEQVKPRRPRAWPGGRSHREPGAAAAAAVGSRCKGAVQDRVWPAGTLPAATCRECAESIGLERLRFFVDLADNAARSHSRRGFIARQSRGKPTSGVGLNDACRKLGPDHKVAESRNEKTCPPGIGWPHHGQGQREIGLLCGSGCRLEGCRVGVSARRRGRSAA